MQLAKAYGMKVLGTAGTAEGEKVVKQAGASQVFNHRHDGYIQNILVLSSKLYFFTCILNAAVKFIIYGKVIFYAIMQAIILMSCQ